MNERLGAAVLEAIGADLEISFWQDDDGYHARISAQDDYTTCHDPTVTGLAVQIQEEVASYRREL